MPMLSGYMPRGFVSFLFLLSVAALWVGVSSPIFYSLDENPSIRLLSLRRLEMETNVDTIIRNELYAGLLAQLPADVIETKTNSKIIEYVTQFSASHEDALTYTPGFSPLNQPNYLSLIPQPFTPLSFLPLNQHSHVVVLPLSANVKYAEYVYTGGLFGTNVLGVKLSAQHAQSLFAVPINYRICVTTIQKNGPCFAGGGGR